MKHALKITALLLLMFFVTQLLGLVVANIYFASGDALPYGMEPPKDVDPTTSLFSIVFAICIAVLLVLLLMKLRVETFLRIWFFVVIILALGITINSAFLNTDLSSTTWDFGFFSTNAASFISFLIALPLAAIKVFRRNVIIHNFTELLIYPGIAVIIIPLLSVWAALVLLVLISLYDLYAVWHAGFMQKMARYQMNNVKVFSGFLVPYIGKKEAEMIRKAKESKSKKMMKKIKINLAILGGGDVVFPIIVAGVVLREVGLLAALSIPVGATIALALLFYFSKKGKFYPAMPFISAGCIFALGFSYLISALML